MSKHLEQLDNDIVNNIIGKLEALIVLTLNKNAAHKTTKTELINHMEYHYSYSNLTIRNAIDNVLAAGLISETADDNDKRVKLISANIKASAVLKKQWIDLINATFPA